MMTLLITLYVFHKKTANPEICRSVTDLGEAGPAVVHTVCGTIRVIIQQ